VALVRAHVSEELRASIIRATRIGELRTLAVTSNRSRLRRNINSFYFVFLHSVCRLLVTANVVPNSPILVILMIEALSSSETSFFTRITRRKITEDGILLNNLYVFLFYSIRATCPSNIFLLAWIQQVACKLSNYT
jgi:hypothetical protein